LLPALLAEWHGDPLRPSGRLRPPGGLSILVAQRLDLYTGAEPSEGAFDGAAPWRWLASYSRDRSLKPTIGSWFPSPSNHTRVTSPSGWPRPNRGRSWKRPPEPAR